MKIKTYLHPHKETWSTLLKRPNQDLTALNTMIQPILNIVKNQGDAALKTFTERFDHIKLKEIRLETKNIQKAQEMIPAQLKKAIDQASENITRFHRSQIQEEPRVETLPGVHCWRKNIPIEKVGFYIPGGSAPLFSTVLMLGIPAQLAGCEEIILCSPPDSKGTLHPAILYTARKIGIEQIYTIGGAQAIAAMAYGTESIPAVNKIFGPGNAYVTTAKQLVIQEGVAIDLPAGPSEVAILADETTRADYVAADLLSQAEHGPDSQVLLVTTGQAWAETVKKQLERQLIDLPREGLATESLKNSRIIIATDLEEGMTIINQYAPEHLIIHCSDAEYWAQKVKNASSVFLGEYSPESAGDYASGTNHILPTNGYAKSYSGISVDSFLKKITFQQLSKEGLKNLSETVETLAIAEGLIAHQRAVRIRFNENTSIQREKNSWTKTFQKKIPSRF
ncbi:MAG: histidinol dehydrogenase [Flavobacteriales bacterium AspAUS03]